MLPTRPFANTSQPRLERLRGTSVLEVAERSREAAADFLKGTGLGWGRRELAGWLVGPYRRATKWAEVGAHPSAAPTARDVEPVAVERLLLTARERIIEMLGTTASDWRSYEFPRRAIESGLVINVKDDMTIAGYIPTSHASMRLVDRVASLFIADYLTRPGDYDDLSLCDECGEISFAWARTHHRYCEAIPFASGIVSRCDEDAPRLTSRGMGAL